MSQQFIERRKDRSDIPYKAAKKQLEYIAREGEFKAALMTTEDGLLVVDISSQYNNEELGGIAALLNEVKKRIELVVQFQTDQIVIKDRSGLSFICRFFKVLGQTVSLTVIAPESSPKQELTDRAIQGLKRILERENI
ncbi:MAG: hypothetical protein JRI44_01235 [Deltaproteobacteria bacterium]|nr:hypothetical protein [Deltaproteobacteria bacterium]